MILNYTRQVLFGLGLMAGVHVPGFLADYARHAEAKQREVRQALGGYQQIANEQFGGDLPTLVDHYRASTDQTLQRDADNMQYLMLHSSILQAETTAMRGPWYVQAWHVLSNAQRNLIQEVWTAYDYQVVFKPDAIAWGLGCGFVLAWMIEAIWLLVSWPVRREPGHGSQRRHRS